MNANELADWIDERNISSSSQTLGKAATMLRQQQAEIANLKAGLLSHHDIYPAKELTQNITGVWRLSDQSIQIVFTSCRSASEFVEILRKASEK